MAKSKYEVEIKSNYPKANTDLGRWIAKPCFYPHTAIRYVLRDRKLLKLHDGEVLTIYIRKEV